MINWWATVLLLASGQGILLSAALLLSRKKRDRSNSFLALILLIISLELLNAWGMQVHYHQSPNAIPFWLLESYLVLPPSLFLFIQSNTNRNFQFNRKQLLLYIPAFIEIITETTAHIRFRFTGKAIHLLDIKAWFFFTEILPALWMTIVLFVYANALQVSRKQPVSPFTPARLHIIKLYGIFVTLTTITICWVAEVIIQAKVFVIIEVVAIAGLFILGYAGYAIPAFFDIHRTTAKLSTGETLFPNYDDQKELIRLKQAFEQQALHTRSRLTVEELAGELRLPVKYVSYLINSHHQTNFHHFINIYRVNEVIRKMEDPTEKHKTLLALAMESGFNSKSSFNQVFKSHTGKTPSQFLK
jgi:AraC-like DNA-binding protein